LSLSTPSILNEKDKLGLGLGLFELRKKSAYDLLNGRTECHIREGPDGRTHFHGENTNPAPMGGSA